MFLHYIMRDGDFGELAADDGVTEFRIETCGCRAGVHAESFIAEVAGDVFGEDHEGASDAFTLHAAGDGHLAETDSGGILAGEEAAAEQSVVFEGAHEDIVLFLIEFFGGKMEAQRFAQNLVTQMDHLLVFFRSVIYHPKCHAVGIVPLPVRRMGRWAGGPENTEKLP